jgi:protein TonB
MLKAIWMAPLMSAAVLAAPAVAQTEANAAPPRLIEHPNWVRKPTGEDVARFYPPDAKKRHINGAAAIACTVTDEGLLTACQVLAEKPPGLGFGEAALKMAPIFRMRPTSKDGQPVAGGAVQIPFQLMTW